MCLVSFLLCWKLAIREIGAQSKYSVASRDSASQEGHDQERVGAPVVADAVLHVLCPFHHTNTVATMSSSIQSRKEELLAKKARLAELKRQRELRQEQFSAGRQSIEVGAEVCTYHHSLQ